MSEKSSLTEQEKQRHEVLFGPIKNKSLLNVAVLYYTFFFGSATAPREAIKQKLWEKGTPLYNDTLAQALKPSDVAPLSTAAKKQHKNLLTC
jgi:hypothetical protein